MQSEPHIPILLYGCAAAGLHNAALPKLGHVSTLGILEMSFFISDRRRSEMTASLFFFSNVVSKETSEESAFELLTVRSDQTAWQVDSLATRFSDYAT